MSTKCKYLNELEFRKCKSFYVNKKFNKNEKLEKLLNNKSESEIDSGTSVVVFFG